MFGYETRAEKEAFKAGIRKAEKVAAASRSIELDALTSLWAKLGANNQTEAIAKIDDLLSDWKAVAESHHNSRLKDHDTIVELRGHLGELSKAHDKLSDAHLTLATKYVELNSLSVEHQNTIDGLKVEISELIEGKEKLASITKDRDEDLKRADQRIAALNEIIRSLNRDKTALMNANCELRGKLETQGESTLSNNARFMIGNAVTKKNGYPFPGEVRAVFRNKAREIRYVVEATDQAYEGMLHIFSGDQLRLMFDESEWMKATKSIGAQIQQEGRALRPVVNDAAKVQRASITADEFAKTMAETHKKLFGVT